MLSILREMISLFFDKLLITSMVIVLILTSHYTTKAGYQHAVNVQWFRTFHSLKKPIITGLTLRQDLLILLFRLLWVLRVWDPPW